MRRANTSDYLLGGLVICKACGHHFVGTAAIGNRYRYRYYTCYTRERYGKNACCSGRLPADELDRAVLASLLETYEREDLIATAVADASARINAARPAQREQLTAVEAEIKNAEAAIDRYFHAFESRAMSEVTCGRRGEALAERVRELRLRQAELRALLGANELSGPEPAALEEIRSLIRRGLEEGPAPQRKAVLQALVAEVRVEGRHAVCPIFRVPMRKVREVYGLVHPEGLEPRKASAAVSRSRVGVCLSSRVGRDRPWRTAVCRRCTFRLRSRLRSTPHVLASPGSDSPISATRPATLMLSRHVHPKVASEVLGQSTVAITLDPDSHVSVTMRPEVAGVVDALATLLSPDGIGHQLTPVLGPACMPNAVPGGPSASLRLIVCAPSAGLRTDVSTSRSYRP